MIRAETALGSTYRLQLHGLGFAGARRLIPYLHELGIETLYLSPIFAAVPGSTHGYDVIDPTSIDPALGTPEEFEGLLDELAGHGMRVLLDVVPNHMATDPSNRWWWDTLRHGQASDSASVFDIDWSRHDGKILLPVLSEPLYEVLAATAVQADPHDRADGPELEFGGSRFPLAPGTDLDDPVADVLAHQHFRPAYWRLGDTEGNYRRFFNIDGLIGVRVEDPTVFERTHGLVVELCRDERVAGIRIDHVDGLWDPVFYLSRLRRAVAAPERPVVLLEKILGPDERLDPRLDVDGTTGYEFAERAMGLFVLEEGCRRLFALGAELSGNSASFEELARAAKHEMLEGSFSGQLDRIASLAKSALDVTTPGHDLSRRDARAAVTQLTMCLDVYRTYADGTCDPSDAARIERARARSSTGDAQALRALRLISDGMARADAASPWLGVARRWQQLSGAVMAKGVEDTATYRYPGLLAMADVGCDPDRAPTTVDEFHRFARSRVRHPVTLNATSTHDSKRNEDARCRLAVLSEAHDDWETLVRRWHRRYAGPSAPDAQSQLMAYQAIVALWPPGVDHLPTSEAARVQDYAIKAAREAQCSTSWADPDDGYERALRRFVTRVISNPAFRKEMARLMRALGPAAAANALALLVLKATAPGVPDFFQGTEFFEATLTDPDNRRPVDFDARHEALTTLPSIPPQVNQTGEVKRLLAGWENGHLKLYVTRTLLHLRRELPELFFSGSFLPLQVQGPFSANFVALARHRRRQWVVAVVPRLTLAIAGRGRFPIGRRTWPGGALSLPMRAPTSFVDIFTGASLDARSGKIDVASMLQTLPIAVLRNNA